MIINRHLRTALGLGRVHYRTITISEKIPKDDPYYILGVERSMELDDVKKKYFTLAKKYHPDLNPDSEYAKKMFLLVGEAFKKIEEDKDPEKRKLRQEAENTYERTPDEREFTSRRKENTSAYYESYADSFGDDAASDWNEEKYLRKFRFRNIRNTHNNMPVHMKNLDRHGLESQRAEAAKPFDKLKIPFPLVVLAILMGVSFVGLMWLRSEGESYDNVSKKAVLQAKKKHQ